MGVMSELSIADPIGAAIALGVTMYILGMAYLVQTALDEGYKWLALTVGGIALLLLGLGAAQAHDHGRTDPHWEAMSQEERDWITNLRQPDNPSLSCCGLADQYWCDGIKVDGDGTYCQITDDRDDAQFNRPHVPVGTWIEIPSNKLKWDKGNPTGHAIVFMNASKIVYCFVQSTGI